jgi:hypothetical protein
MQVPLADGQVFDRLFDDRLAQVAGPAHDGLSRPVSRPVNPAIEPSEQ